MAPRRLLRLVFAGALASPACFVSDPIRLPPLDDNGARPEAGAGGAGGRVEGGDAGSPMGAGGASDRGGAAASAGASGAPSAGAAGAAGDYGPRLRGAPLVFTPTARGFGVSAALEVGDPTQLQAQIRAEGASDWERPVAPRTPAPDLAEWSFDGLEPGVRYEYAITANDADLEAALYTAAP